VKQVRNQHTGAAGITAREGNQLHSMWHKLHKLYKKPNLFVGHKQKVAQCMELIHDLLEESGRL
tara:strand:- start:1213 stop:1404 length:192 start_codon:yes stop_codon:yes gene_type:complete